MFGIATARRGIRLHEYHARPAVWNDFVQQRREGHHCALGWQPEAAQSLEMIDRSHRTPATSPRDRKIAPPAPHEQGAQQIDDSVPSQAMLSDHTRMQWRRCAVIAQH